DSVLHVDRHLAQLTAQYHGAVYAILFIIIFAETGLVVTPFLPGDSLLFAAGALAAAGGSGTLDAPVLWVLLAGAAALGNTTNYAIGRAVGVRAFSGNHRLFRVEYLNRTEAFFQRYGAMTIVLSRFMPIIRTFAPFVAGIGRMPYLRFQLFNLLGAVAWTALFVWGGYIFGNIPIVKANFGLVTIAIILISLAPMGWTALAARRR
ncbi:MAG TPA: VTT domain-containing protein, partial [Steroidobacteraceae bacterium]|nr:VTT domain-containing protein [Steroidobacteraceae bacterium]